MNNTLFRLAICSAIVFCCLACAAAKHPILAPNEHPQEMTADTVQRDIDECMRIAKEAGPGAARSKKIAGQTAGGAAVGAASGAFAGAISGGPGLGAAAGAAGGATAGLLSGLLGSSDLDYGQQRYAEDCLRQKGYNPIGWQWKNVPLQDMVDRVYLTGQDLRILSHTGSHPTLPELEVGLKTNPTPFNQPNEA